MSQFNLAVFASGSGTNAERIVRYFEGHPAIRVSAIYSNNPNAFVLVRARDLGVPTVVFDRTQYRDETTLPTSLQHHGVTHIVLAGFLWLIPAYLIRQFPERIINIHPALLPKYGGKGMYGSKVHEAVRASGDLQTGITIHLVNEHFDEGRVLFQHACDIGAHFTPEEIAHCVHELEYAHYPRVIEEWILGKVN